MIENISFEELYFKLCDYIGSTEEELIQALGEPDQIDIGSYNNRYLIYEEIEAMFEISAKRGVLICVTTPVRPDSKRIREGYYNILGAKVGDTEERIIQMWGNPSEIEGVELIYNSRLGTTSTGYNFETRLAIKDGILQDFSGVMFIQTAKKQKSGCFVATACYGNYNAKEVIILREYRDKVLLNKPLGRVFVDIYYKFSPPFAKIIEKSSILKSFIRVRVLSPIVRKISKFQ